MRSILPLSLLCSLPLLAQDYRPEVWKPKLIGVTEVGKVFQDCAHVRKGGGLAETPIGFSVTPDSAFRLAVEKIKIKCPSEFGNFVYADSDYYYITVGPVDTFLGISRKDISPANLNEFSVRVHGLTGKVLPPNNLK